MHILDKQLLKLNFLVLKKIKHGTYIITLKKENN
jgi:hypothetical protein